MELPILFVLCCGGLFVHPFCEVDVGVGEVFGGVDAMGNHWSLKNRLFIILVAYKGQGNTIIP